MRNFIFIFCFFAVSSIYAQEKPPVTSLPKSEISFDALRFSTGDRLELAFDHFLNKSESVGINISYNSYFFEQGFNYKHYFSKKNNQGFYLQVGLSNYLYKDYSEGYLMNTKQKFRYSMYFDFNLGYKIVSERNCSIDFYSGFSQPIIGASIDEYNKSNRKLDFNFGIRIGKRF